MKQRLKRLFFPDFCFNGTVSLYQQSVSNGHLILWPLLLGCCSLILSIKLFVFASIWCGLLCNLCTALLLIPGSRQMEYLKTLPFSPWEYALGRLLWSLVCGIASVLPYVVVLVLMQGNFSVKYGLSHSLTYNRILLWGLLHFSVVVLACELTVLIRTRLSFPGFLWILIPLAVGALAVTGVDSGLLLFVLLWMRYVTGPVCIAVFCLLPVLTTVCFLRTVRSFERWEAVEQRLSPFKPLVIMAVVLALATDGFFLLRKTPYISPVDESLTPEEQYQVAVQCQEDGDLYGAAVSFYACGEYLDAGQRCRELWGQIVSHSTIAATDTQVVALTRDGRVLVTSTDHLSNQAGKNAYAREICLKMEDIPDPHRLVSIHGGSRFVAGLYDDGTVSVFGEVPDYWYDEISGWTDIVALSVSSSDVIGLRADGTAMTCSYLSSYYYDKESNSHQVKINQDFIGRKNLVAVSVGPRHIAELHPDGTVSTIGQDGNGRNAVWFWKDVVDIGCGETHTVGLHSDGTVSVTGYGGWGQCALSDWTDVMDIETGCYCTVGLRSDGTVLTAGALGEMGDLDVVGTWTDIVAISVSDAIALGLKADGTLVAAGYTQYIQDLLDQWDNIRLPG